jgi:hypothetical protein
MQSEKPAPWGANKGSAARIPSRSSLWDRCGAVVRKTNAWSSPSLGSITPPAPPSSLPSLEPAVHQPRRSGQAMSLRRAGQRLEPRGWEPLNPKTETKIVKYQYRCPYRKNWLTAFRGSVVLLGRKRLINTNSLTGGEPILLVGTSVHGHTLLTIVSDPLPRVTG